MPTVMLAAATGHGHSHHNHCASKIAWCCRCLALRLAASAAAASACRRPRGSRHAATGGQNRSDRCFDLFRRPHSSCIA